MPSLGSRSPWRAASAALAVLLLAGAGWRLVADEATKPAPGLRERLLARVGVDAAAWKDLSPAARRARLRELPQAERRAMLREARALRAAERGGGDAKAPRRLAEPGRVVRDKVVGTIQYDTGNVVGFFANGGNGGKIYKGNRFDTANGDPLAASGTITRITAALRVASTGVTTGPTTVTSAVLLVGGPSSGGTAPLLTSTFLPATSSTTTVISGTLPYAGGSFIVGIDDFSGFNATASMVPGFDTATTAGQGFHAVSFSTLANETSEVGPDGTTATALTGITDIPDHNMVIRVTGDVLVPVELMSFSVEK